MRTRIIAALLLAAAVGTHPAEAGHFYGTTTCAEWTEHATAVDATQAGIMVNMARKSTDQAYVLGWLSALNAVQDFDMLAGIGADSVIGWISDYCRAHPTAFVAEAADHLGGALIAQKTRELSNIGSLGRPAGRHQ
jgi:hypothetical protein